MMNSPKTRLLVAAMALGLPCLVFAQAVVPPPIAPGVKTAPAQVQVAPPQSVTSANPAAAVTSVPTPSAAPTQSLIDIALPDAPKPAPKLDLKPAAPVEQTSSCLAAAEKACSSPKSAKPKAAAKKPHSATNNDGAVDKTVVEEKAAKPVDPFSGLVGTPVSDSQLNRFVFPSPVEGIYFQEGAPLPECPKDAAPSDPCKPVFLNGKRVMLLQLRAGAKGTFQMVAHLNSGDFKNFNLTPVAGPGAVIRVDGAEDGASDARLAASSKLKAKVEADGMTSSEQYVAMLSRFAAGDIPPGFEAIKVSAPIRFEHFDVIPTATWDNGTNLRAHLFQVKAHGSTPVRIDASLFRSANVRALALDRTTITNSEPAHLYMLEFVPAEAQ